jgi:hypothetical protein
MTDHTMPEAYLSAAELERLYRQLDRAERLAARRSATPAVIRRPKAAKPASGGTSARRQPGKEGR